MSAQEASRGPLSPHPAAQHPRPMESVFVVPRMDLFPNRTPHGLAPFGAGPDAWDRTGTTGLLEAQGFFVERARAEVTPAWKQPIPYALVHGTAGVLCLRRKRAGSEARLHDKLSIGVGGHVEPLDLPDPSTPSQRSGLLARAALRELHEELVLPETALDVRPLGLLNDDTNEVGAVHVGLVCAVHVEDCAAVTVRETEQLEGEFVPPAQLRERAAAGANFESWSALLLPHLEALLADSASTVAVPG